VTDTLFPGIVSISASDPDGHFLASEPADFESWINWIIRSTKKKTHETISLKWKWLCQSYSMLAQQPMDCFTTNQVRRVWTGGAICGSASSFEHQEKPGKIVRTGSPSHQPSIHVDKGPRSSQSKRCPQPSSISRTGRTIPQLLWSPDAGWLPWMQLHPCPTYDLHIGPPGS